MKKIFTAIALVALSATCSVNALDIRGALNRVTSSKDSTSQSSGVLGFIGNVLGMTDVTIEQLEGDWKYVKPAVAFKSDDLLRRAGGEVAAGAIEEKVKPYYEKAGLTSMTMTFNADSTFVMKVKGISIKGSLEKGADDNFTFKFKAVGRVSLGSLASVITRNGNNINVTFDATKLMALVTKIASITGNQTLGTAASLLNSYDGLNLGFELSRVQGK